jgi:hypothetical protein
VVNAVFYEEALETGETAERCPVRSECALDRWDVTPIGDRQEFDLSAVEDLSREREPVESLHGAFLVCRCPPEDVEDFAFVPLKNPSPRNTNDHGSSPAYVVVTRSTL